MNKVLSSGFKGTAMAGMGSIIVHFLHTMLELSMYAPFAALGLVALFLNVGCFLQAFWGSNA